MSDGLRSGRYIPRRSLCRCITTSLKCRLSVRTDLWLADKFWMLRRSTYRNHLTCQSPQSVETVLCHFGPDLGR